MNAEPLSKYDLDCLMRGGCFLGSGGGGGLRMARVVLNTLESMAPVELTDLADIDDDEWICFVAGVGAPTAHQSTPFFKAPFNSVRELEKLTGREYRYVIFGETGAVNGLLPLLAAAQSDGTLKAVNADGGGRAFPQLKMCTFALGAISALTRAASLGVPLCSGTFGLWMAMKVAGRE